MLNPIRSGSFLNLFSLGVDIFIQRTDPVRVWTYMSNIIFSCKDEAQQVLIYVCLSVCLCLVNLKIYLTTSFYNIQDVLECSRMFQNVPKCSRMFQDVQGCSRMFKDVQGCSRMFKDVSGCSGVPIWNSVCVHSLQVCTTLYKSVQHCTSLYNIVQACTKLYKSVQACSYISLHEVS